MIQRRQVRPLKVPDAPVLARVCFNDAKSGVMREGNGYVYLLLTHGNETIRAQIMDDGTLVLPEDWVLHPYMVVTIIDPRALGVEIKRGKIWGMREVCFV